MKSFPHDSKYSIKGFNILACQINLGMIYLNLNNWNKTLQNKTKLLAKKETCEITFSVIYKPAFANLHTFLF